MCQQQETRTVSWLRIHFPLRPGPALPTQHMHSPWRNALSLQAGSLPAAQRLQTSVSVFQPLPSTRTVLQVRHQAPRNTSHIRQQRTSSKLPSHKKGSWIQLPRADPPRCIVPMCTHRPTPSPSLCPPWVWFYRSESPHIYLMHTLGCSQHCPPLVLGSLPRRCPVSPFSQLPWPGSRSKDTPHARSARAGSVRRLGRGSLRNARGAGASS